MEKKLKDLLDYQRFSRNPRLSALIEKTEQKYGRELSDDDLGSVSAAGETPPAENQKPPDSGDSDNA